MMEGGVEVRENWKGSSSAFKRIGRAKRHQRHSPVNMSIHASRVYLSYARCGVPKYSVYISRYTEEGGSRKSR